MTSPDVFLSYARANSGPAEKLASAIEALGHDVWWDRELGAGDRFRQIIEDQLTSARCAVVIWSEASVQSDWVLGEAGRARERGILVPVAIDHCDPPIEFRQLHTVDLTDWIDSDDAEHLDAVLNEIQRRLNPGFVPLPRIGRKLPWWRSKGWVRIATGLGALSFTAGIVGLLVMPTTLSETICRKVSLCVSFAPRIEDAEPIAPAFYLVALDRPGPGAAVYENGDEVLVAMDGETGLLNAGSLPRTGDYAPTSLAKDDVVMSLADDLAALSPELLLKILDRLPRLTENVQLAAPIVTSIGQPQVGLSCSDLVAAAQRTVALKRFGVAADSTSTLRISLSAEAYSCDRKLFPDDW